MEVPNEVPVNATNEQPNEPEVKTAEDYFGYDPEVVEGLRERVEPDSPEEGPDVIEKINQTLKEVKVDDNGKFIYPEDIDPTLKAAVAATKSFRDTQSAYTKSQQKLKAMEAEIEALKSQVTQTVDPTAILPEEDRKKLAELKFTNPDQWYLIMQRLEKEAQGKVSEQMNGVRSTASKEAEIELRKKMLEEFNSGKDNPLTVEQLEAEVPPAWGMAVLEGKMDFSEFLDKAYTFLNAGKTVVNTPKPEKTADLNKIPGGKSMPSSDTPDIDYANITF